MADKQINVELLAGTIRIVTSDTVSTGTATIVTNGEVSHIVLVTPDMEGSDSTNLEVLNENGFTYAETGTSPESTTTSIGTIFPLHGTSSIVVTAEGTQSANRDIVYNIFYKV